MRKILFLYILLSLQTQAAITITQINGASTTPDLTQTTIKVFGGISGSIPCGDTGNPVNTTTGFCNSCAIDPPDLSKGCNERQIGGNLKLEFILKSDSTSGTMQIRDSTSSATLLESVAYTVGQEATLVVSWDDLCQHVANSPGPCESIRSGGNPGFSTTFNIGVDADGNNTLDDFKSITINVASIPSGVTTSTDGIENYALFPGDSKAVIEDLALRNDNFNGTKAKAIRFYYRPATVQAGGFPGSATACSADSPNIDYLDPSVEVELVEVNDALEPSSQILDDAFENGVYYATRAAIRDEAGNVGLFYDTTGVNSEPCREFRHNVFPQSVEGLTSGAAGGCFIATAAYGSPYEKHVQVIRLFRDMYLAKSDWGQQFIGFYYAHSPQVANVIRESEVLKFFTRIVLTPVWALSYSLVHWGLVITTLILGGFVLLSMWSFKKIKSSIFKFNHSELKKP